MGQQTLSPTSDTKQATRFNTTTDFAPQTSNPKPKMMKSQPESILCIQIALLCLVAVQLVSARATASESPDNAVSAVIPSPNDNDYGESQIDDIRKMTTAHLEPKLDARPTDSGAPVYVSPFARPARSAASSTSASAAGPSPQASSQVPLKHAATSSHDDLKASASYGELLVRSA